MAENSPSKLRASVTSQNQFHPYGRQPGKHSNLPVKNQTEGGNGKPSASTRVPLATLNLTTNKQTKERNKGGGGDYALFPSSTRAPMTQLCQNVLNNQNNKTKGGPTKTVSPLKENIKGSECTTTTTTNPAKKKAPDFGPVGSSRPSSQGFIQLKSSCTLDKDGIKSTTTSPDTFPMSISQPSSCASTSSKENNNNSTTSGLRQTGSLNTSLCDKFSSAVVDSEKKIVTKKGILTERQDPYVECTEYSDEIFDYWREYEERSRPKPYYMVKQADITHRMRSILVDWMVEVALEYDMQEETLHLSVGLLDRFMSKMAVIKNRLQLVGTAALYIAAKYEEISPPDILDFVYITDETYQRHEIIKMENIILNVLQFDLMVPSCYDFAKLFCYSLKVSSRTRHLAFYLCELSLEHGDIYLPLLPSHIATAAVALARYTVDGIFWDMSLELLSRYSVGQIYRCCQHLMDSFYGASVGSHTAIYDKYKSVAFSSVSIGFLPAGLPAMDLVMPVRRGSISKIVGATVCENSPKVKKVKGTDD